MPIHIENMTSEITTVTEDFPLGEEQIELLVKIVLKRLDQKMRDARQQQESTGLRGSASEGLLPGEKAG